jgi:TonB family protein
MYEAWDQPGSVNDRKLMAVVLVKVARDGSIVGVTLKQSSGNKLMDNSALAAARKVRMLEPPPDALVKGSAAEISVDFQMEG